MNAWLWGLTVVSVIFWIDICVIWYRVKGLARDVEQLKRGRKVWP